MTERKNIVIVGLGIAAIHLSRALEKTLPATHRIVIVTESDAAFDQPASVRAAVVPGWEEKVTAPAVNLFPKNSPHLVLASTKVLQIGEHSVLVDTVHPGFGEVIEFDYAVLATGLSYDNAFQPTRGMKRDEITASLLDAQAGIKAAESVLIAGGGTTGVELAGEIKAVYPNKAVTIVTSGADLTPGDFDPRLGKNLEAQLNTAGVDVHFNTRLNTGRNVTGPIPLTSFPLPAGGAVEADFLIVAYGSKPNSELMQAFDPSALTADSFVRIDKSNFQIEGHPTWFAVGDIAASGDAKVIIAALNHASIVSANIAALLAGKKPVKGWSPPLRGILISFGPNGGAGELPLPFFKVVGSWVTWAIKSRTMMIGKFQGEFAH